MEDDVILGAGERVLLRLLSDLGERAISSWTLMEHSQDSEVQLVSAVECLFRLEAMIVICLRHHREFSKGGFQSPESRMVEETDLAGWAIRREEHLVYTDLAQLLQIKAMTLVRLLDRDPLLVEQTIKASEGVYPYYTRRVGDSLTYARRGVTAKAIFEGERERVLREATSDVAPTDAGSKGASSRRSKRGHLRVIKH